MYRQGTRRQFTIDNILAISECTQVSSFSEEKKQRRKHGGVECSRLYQQINTIIPSHFRPDGLSTHSYISIPTNI
jgi:hypothetical protein